MGEYQAFFQRVQFLSLNVLSDSNVTSLTCDTLETESSTFHKIRGNFMEHRVADKQKYWLEFGKFNPTMKTFLHSGFDRDHVYKLSSMFSRRIRGRCRRNDSR